MVEAPRSDTFAKIDIIDGVVKINGETCDCDADCVVTVLDALDITFEIEEFNTYEGTDCVDYAEDRDPDELPY